MTKKDGLSIAILTIIFTWITGFLIFKVEMMPAAASHEALLVDRAFDGMVKGTVPIFALVLSVLLYTLVRFSATGSDEEGLKIYRSKNGLLETGWISLSLVLTLALAALGSKEFLAIRGSDRADLNIQVKAAQFSWEFYYPEQNIYSSELLLPNDRRVRILLSSEDVVHAFWVPEFRLKQDIVPGKVVKLLFTPIKTGNYTLLCAELCGMNHTVMTAPVRVVPTEDFEKALKGQVW